MALKLSPEASRELAILFYSMLKLKGGDQLQAVSKGQRNSQWLSYAMKLYLGLGKSVFVVTGEITYLIRLLQRLNLVITLNQEFTWEDAAFWLSVFSDPPFALQFLSAVVEADSYFHEMNDPNFVGDLDEKLRLRDLLSPFAQAIARAAWR